MLGSVTDLRFLSPPLKERLWQALKSRDIDLVISDHSPCTVDLKLMDRGDFMAAWGGISSVQYGEGPITYYGACYVNLSHLFLCIIHSPSFKFHNIKMRLSSFRAIGNKDKRGFFPAIVSIICVPSLATQGDPWGQ